MISESFIWWSLAAVLLFWSVGAYNRLVRLRSHALRSFAVLAVPMQRYVEIVQSGAVNHTDVSVTPAADTAPEARTQAWIGLLGAQAQFSASLAVACTRPLDGAAINALAAADTVLQMAWSRLSWEGGDANAAPLYKTAQTQWSDNRQQILPAAQAFAHAIQNYNTAVKQFPALLLAWIFGFRSATSLPIAP